MYTLIQTAKLNDVDPQAWLGHVVAEIAIRPEAEALAAAEGRATVPRLGQKHLMRGARPALIVCLDKATSPSVRGGRAKRAINHLHGVRGLR